MIELYVGNVERAMKQLSISQRQQLLSLICVERRQRIERLSVENKKECALLAGVMMEQLGRKYMKKNMGMNVGKLNISYEEQGKPFFTNYPNVHFNLSHSGSWVVFAIGDCPVGIDVEVVKDAKEEVAKRCFHGDEYEKLLIAKKQSTNEFNELFYRYWTMKEAFLKWNGLGLTCPLNELIMEPERGLLRGNDAVTFSFPWLQDGIVVTLCAKKGQPVTLREYRRETMELFIKEYNDNSVNDNKVDICRIHVKGNIDR